MNNTRMQFNDYTKIIVVKGKERYKYYEKEVKENNICCFQPMRSTKRDEEFNNNNTEYFKELFNRENCLPCEMIFH